jgi:hypothetical protein
MPTLDSKCKLREGGAGDEDSSLWITGIAPAEFEPKQNLTKLRKEVMQTYLEKQPCSQIAERTPENSQRLPKVHDSIRTIKLWQENTSLELEPGQVGVIARLLQGCLELLSSLLSQASTSTTLPQKANKALQRTLATLQLWADGHSVLDGKLDIVLERSEGLRQTTLATLNALCGVLVEQ